MTPSTTRLHFARPAGKWLGVDQSLSCASQVARTVRERRLAIRVEGAMSPCFAPARPYDESWGICAICESGSNPRPLSKVAPLECSLVKTSATGFSLRACSTCAIDGDCATGEVCGIEFDFEQQETYRKCEPRSTRSAGSICETNAQCSGGNCDRYEFPDGTNVGVCGECNSDTDCSGAETCQHTTFDFEVGFTPRAVAER